MFTKNQLLAFLVTVLVCNAIALQEQDHRHLRNKKGSRSRLVSPPTNHRELQGLCEVNLKKICVSGGRDGYGDLFMEGDLMVYHAGPDGLPYWQDVTLSPVDWVYIPVDGCIDINKTIRPLARGQG